MLKNFANGWSKDSFANRLRQTRLRLLAQVLADFKPPVSILDVGGQPEFWNSLDLRSLPEVTVVILNLFPTDVSMPNAKSCEGDARSMKMVADGEFDVAFSNSVIEHVGGLRDQKAMAQECMRVARTYFVQTPNRYFPLEPHFLLPGFQFLPHAARAYLHSKRDLGW